MKLSGGSVKFRAHYIKTRIGWTVRTPILSTVFQIKAYCVYEVLSHQKGFLVWLTSRLSPSLKMTTGNLNDGPRFVLPSVADNPHGWGPSTVPEELSNVPYAPYSKSDRLGKIADWTAPAGGDGYDRRYGQEGDRRRRFGPTQEAFGSGLTSVFAYTVAAEDEATFSVVDRQSATQKKPGFKTQRGGRAAGRTGGAWQTRGPQGAGQRRDDRRGQHQAPRRRYGGYNDKPARIRDASVQVGADWKVVEELDFPRMNKLYYEVDGANDL